METLTTNAADTRKKDLLQVAAEIGPMISQYINEEENNRRLSRPVFDALTEAGFTSLFLPASLGGAEADPLIVAKLVEEVSSHNTAAGWCLMVANTSAWWCRRFPEKGIEEVYKSGPGTFISGAFHPPMKATPVDGGYTIKGRTPLTSNVHEAQWIFVTAIVMDKGEMKINNGIPEVIAVLMKQEDCEISDTWQVLGMKATDSNDTVANDVFVPTHCSFVLSPEFQLGKYHKGPLYQFPAMGISVACLIAPVALAVASNAINELRLLADKKTPLGSMFPIRERAVVQRKLGEAEAMVQSSRAYLYYQITESWNKTLAGEKMSLEERGGLLLAGVHANQSCAKAVDMMYTAAGSTGIYTRSKLSHYFTDSQVIRQHGFANESRYETVAQIFFGLPPDLPVVAF